VLLATAVLAGCGGDGGGLVGGAASSEPNATDAAFARAMVVHERALGSMAQLGRRKALRDELRGIAKETLARNDRELSSVRELADELRSQGVSRIGGGIGEPPPFDARGLRRAVSFDHEFLARMISAHEYAMAAAAVERRRGADSRLRVVAQSIYESSRRDLAKLRRWLSTWYGGDTQPPPLPPPGGGGGGGGGGASPGPEV